MSKVLNLGKSKKNLRNTSSLARPDEPPVETGPDRATSEGDCLNPVLKNTPC
jgi:hypothetical protein